MAEFLILFREQIFPQALDIFLSGWPVWAPIIAIYAGFNTWLQYIHRHWLKTQGYVLLEIKLPREVPKSPAAMEFVLQGIWENANIGTPAEAFWEGKLREWFSLEIVALNGEVRFFIWAFPRWKKIVETRIYSQYPNAEVHEVQDYALNLRYEPNVTYMSGVNTALVKPDAYPINTYIQYQLDKKSGSPEDQQEIVDPLTPVIEYLGTFGAHEFASFQMIIRAHAKEDYLYGRLATKKDWGDDVKAEIKKLIEKEALVKPEKDKPPSLLALTDDQKATIAAIERNAGKLAFDTMIRIVYLAPQNNYDKTRMMGLIGSMRQFGTKNMNGIKPTFPFAFAHSWQDFKSVRKQGRLRELMEAYKRRAFFGTPFYHLHDKPYILTTEELATLYHLPSIQIAATPTLVRLPSKKSEAPANLPI